MAEVAFDGLKVRSDIWNLPLSNMDHRWYLFNDLIGKWLSEQGERQGKFKFLEIGVWQAGTVRHVHERFAGVFDYIGVDPYGEIENDPYKGRLWKTSNEANEVYRQAQAQFDYCGATLLRQAADDYFAGAGKDEVFDVVFIDGDHRYRQALTDCKNGLAHLRSGGLLIVDDVGNSFHPEVEWAVRHFVEQDADHIAAKGIHPLFFQLPGSQIPVVLEFFVCKKK